ncbi:hypothetical protein [Virgibacillus sp. L01]
MSLEFGALSLEFGALSLEFGALSLEFGALSPGSAMPAIRAGFEITDN